MLRYRTDETDDGLSGKEGTFLICSFWLVSALAIVGELQRARDLMERLLRIASPLGLYAEEFDAETGRHLGNFPQAFSHLALIEAAARIIVPEHAARSTRGHGRPTTSSSSAPARAAGRSPVTSRRPASGSSCSSAATGCRASPQNWLAQDVFVDNRYVSEDTWYDADGKPFQPQIHYFVGGATKLYGAALYRLREEDFGELRHHDGLSPAWPISYDELEPYYTQAEQLYQVHGARGEDPTEPPRERALSASRPSRTSRGSSSSPTTWPAAGYHPFHAPCGILLDEANMPYSTCVRCANCDGFPCLVHAKSDAEVLGVRPALEHANVTLLTNAKAVKLETNPAGTAVTEVVVERDGEDGAVRGRRRRRRVRRGQHGQAPASRRRTTSIRTVSPTAPTRSGATSCSTTARRCSRSRARRTRPSSRRRSG